MPTALPSSSNVESELSGASNTLSSLLHVIPLYLRPSFTVQLVASYTLGLLTALFFLQPR